MILLRQRAKQYSVHITKGQWELLASRLTEFPSKLSSLELMERSGGEPAVIHLDPKTDKFWIVDCASESPAGRRSLCYDQQALESRKQHKPKGSALEMARSMGVELLTEEQYRFLQTLGVFDTKTSSWIQTPKPIRDLGGALFCDRRYNKVFTYHNGAESYYGARGFRSILTI